VDLTSFGDQARIGALWSLREERKARTMGEPVDAYLLYVNQQQVPDVFEALEEAEVSAKPYMQNQATLQIKTTWDSVRTWDYRYDLNQWLELSPRG
jgi:hypothetical protein